MLERLFSALSIFLKPFNPLKIRHAEKMPTEKSGHFSFRTQILSACRKYGSRKWARNVGLIGDILSPRVKPVTRWLGREGSNLRMSVPKTDALPLGDAPIHLETQKLHNSYYNGKCLFLNNQKNLLTCQPFIEGAASHCVIFS